MHFDYPYYAERNDGLNDEILGTVWTRNGSIKLVGSDIPADSIVSGTPCFGYRCLQSASSGDYISCSSSAFSLSSGSYQFTFWLRVTASQAGNVFVGLSGGAVNLNITLNAERKLTLNIPDASLSVTSSTALPLNTWTQCAVNITVSSSSTSATLIVNGAKTTGSGSGLAILAVSEARLGGFAGQLDEFMFSDRILGTLPSEPVQGTLNLTELGGFGTGALGNVTISSDCVINTYAQISSINRSAKTLTFDTGKKYVGKFGDFSVNSEVMLIDSEGNYSFRTLTSYNANTGTMSFSDFASLPSTFTGTVSGMQVISMSNFNTLTINSGVTVSPLSWTGYAGGIVAFRVKGNCTINGSIITSGKGRTRTDMMQMTHAKLIDNFITNTGGGIFILCGGKFTAPSTARLGAAWDGALTGGTSSYRTDGTPGGAGYGGAGGSDVDNNGLGGKGGVGGGGGGGDGAQAGQAGQSGVTGATLGAAGTGGGGAAHGSTSSAGGTQGVNPNSDNAGWATGGGGAGGNSGQCTGYYAEGAQSGANLVLIANVLSVDASAISTGGSGGRHTLVCTGGGGTGFAYIAAKSLV